MRKAAQVLEKVEDINQALVKVKEGLYSVKVSQYDTTKVQREIESKLFDKWYESCEAWFICVWTQPKRNAVETWVQAWIEKTLDNNDLNQVVASSGLVKTRVWGGAQSRGLIKAGLGHSCLRIFDWGKGSEDRNWEH